MEKAASPAANLLKLADYLARPQIVFFTLPYLMALIVAGTLAQKSMGLYAAQKMFFSSFIFWLGPVPLPGGYSVMALIFVCLLLKFLFRSPWVWAKAGTLLAHFGVLVLLFGGLLTAATAQEGFVVIDEKASSSIIRDYHDRVLVVSKDDEKLLEIPAEDLRRGKIIAGDTLPFTVKVVSYCANCEPVLRQEKDTKEIYHGPAAKIEMKPIKAEKENESNHAAVTLSITKTKEDQDGIYLLTELMPHKAEIADGDTVYKIGFGKKETALPFSLTLKDVVRDVHPGTDTPRSYHSDLIVNDSGTTWPVTISMNNPLRYRGYTFYQSNFISDEKGETTVLSAVWNAGRLFPYVASAIIAAGLLLHLLIALGLRRRALPLLALTALVSFYAPPATAQELSFQPDLSAFASIPVQHEGRIKPLESFAIAHMRLFSGQSHLDDMSAAHWLAEALFDPVSSNSRPVFSIRSRELRALLDLPARSPPLYSFMEISPGMEMQLGTIRNASAKALDTLPQVQKDLLDLHRKATLYAEIMRSLSLLLPLAIDVPTSLKQAKEKDATIDYLALQKLRERAGKRLESIIKRKGSDITRYSDEEKAIALFSWQLDVLDQGAQGNDLLRIVPPQWQSGGTIWRAPWALLQEGQGSPATAAFLDLWKGMADAWIKGDSASWKDHTQKTLSASHDLAGFSSADKGRIKLERLYNKSEPYNLALSLYALAVLLIMGVAFLKRGERLFKYAGVTSALCAFAIHGAALASRIYILERPPVSTLYESMLFVSFIGMLVAVIIAARTRDRLYLAGGSFVASLLLLLSFHFALQQGDTMVMLVAVLNTNFWLATHVICVTIGYGFCVLAGALAHIWLFQKGFGTLNEGLYPVMHRVAIAALMFTATGTILGGIWADQSWGRFWGWDPKENGALVIVLWIIWLFHGRIAGMLNNVFYAAGLAFLNIVVALAWFGVNLLSVGLHSYGFISGIAFGLAAFCAIEITLIAALVFKARRRSLSYA